MHPALTATLVLSFLIALLCVGSAVLRIILDMLGERTAIPLLLIITLAVAWCSIYLEAQKYEKNHTPHLSNQPPQPTCDAPLPEITPNATPLQTSPFAPGSTRIAPGVLSVPRESKRSTRSATPPGVPLHTAHSHTQACTKKTPKPPGRELGGSRPQPGYPRINFVTGGDSAASEST